MRAEEVLEGVLDVHLPVARRDFHSLVLEFKVNRNNLTEAQKIEREFLLAENNAAHTIWAWWEAARIAVWYLELEPPHPAIIVELRRNLLALLVSGSPTSPATPAHS